MGESRTEIEIKLPFESASCARQRIDELGARLSHARHFEDNCLFDRAGDPLLAAGKALRLRRTDQGSLLTLKEPVQGMQRHKVREEHETGVDDPIATTRLLQGLGFSPRYRYQKYRTTFVLDDLVVCLDETPLGCFVELEGPPAEIDRTAARLGFSPEQYLRESYLELARSSVGEGILRSGGLLFAPERPGELAVKAMVLAAGVGQRMRPLNSLLPKPALPVLGRPLIVQILHRLKLAGVDEAVVNLHHLPRIIEQVVGQGNCEASPTIHYSLETELLGTAGGLRNAARWLRGDGPIVVCNGDSLSDADLVSALAAHRRSGLGATLVLSPWRPGYSSVLMDAAGRVLSLAGEPVVEDPTSVENFLFTGCHILEPEILDLIPEEGPSDIVRDVYRRMARDKELGGWVHRGFWWEFGSPDLYLEGSLRLLQLPREQLHTIVPEHDLVHDLEGAVAAIGPGAEVLATARLAGGVALGYASCVGDGARVENSVVMAEAWIGPGARLRRAVIGVGVELPAQFEVEDALVCTDPGPGLEPAPNTRRAAGLLIAGLRSAAGG